MTITFKDKSFIVLGIGVTGLSMVRYITSKGADVSVVDDRLSKKHLREIIVDLPNTITFDEAIPVLAKDAYDYLAISPGVPMSHPLVKQAKKLGIPVFGDVELFFNEKKILKNTKIVGITGSNGKTTVTEMVGAICHTANVSYVLGGNIGKPVLDILQEIRLGERDEPEVMVFELSSFQLDATRSHAFDVAILLNVTEDHMDRYDNFQSYVDSKFRIFDRADKKIINQKKINVKKNIDSSYVTFGLCEVSSGKNWGIQKNRNSTAIYQGSNLLLDVGKLKAIGKHNIENCLAAAAITDLLNIRFESISEALEKFPGLPHRVHMIGEFKGVKFIDDSKGTNVGATVAALGSYSGTAILILGGEGKGQDFMPLRDAVSKGCRGVVLMGRDKNKIATVFEGLDLPIKYVNNMDDAVKGAYQYCRDGDVVLLSPACASFDMFEDYKDRSRAFRVSVESLAELL